MKFFIFILWLNSTCIRFKNHKEGMFMNMLFMPICMIVYVLMPFQETK